VDDASRKPIGIASAAAFLAAALAGVVLFLHAFSPKPYEFPTPPFSDYDPQPMQAALAPEAVREATDRLLAFGSRYAGQDGFYAVERYLRERFADAGLEIWEQNVSTVLPKTHRAELLVDGEPSNVRLLPFLPNHIQPMNTPPGGLTGKIIELDDEVLRTRLDFSDCIGLLNAAEPAPEAYGYDWTRYAQLGLPALIVAHPDGLQAITWSKTAPLVGSTNPVNYVRLAASNEIFRLVGSTVTLHVRTSFDSVSTKTIVARLKAGGGDAPATEAIVIPCSYDAGSVLPDLAQGAAQALSIAVQQKLMEGLLNYRDELRRDVIFVCHGAHVMAQDSQNNLLAAIGQATAVKGRYAELLAEREANDAKTALVKRTIALFDDDNFFRDPKATTEALNSAGEAAAFFEKQCTFVRNTIVFELSEEMLQAKIAFEKAERKNNQDEAFAAYSAARKRYDKAFAAAGHNIEKLLRTQQQYLREYDLRGRLLKRFATLLQYHQRRHQRLNQDIALHQLFAGYRSFVVLAPQLIGLEEEQPAKRETLSFSMGRGANYKSEHPIIIRNQLKAAGERLGLKPSDFDVLFAGRSHDGTIVSKTAAIPAESRLWYRFSYPAFSIMNADRAGSYEHYYDPIGPAFAAGSNGLRRSLAITGEAILSAAFGNGDFPGVTTKGILPSFNGNVYVANVGQSILPNYPMPEALLSHKDWRSGALEGAYFRQLLFKTDPYGHYCYPYCATDFGPAYGYSPDASAYGKNGIISHIKDCGITAQSVYASMNLGGARVFDPVNLSLYRAAPVTLLDTVNPQTLKPFAGVDFIRKRGLVAFDSTNTFTQANIVTGFVKPDEHFYVTLKAGSQENELSQTIRAFMLGTDTITVGTPQEQERDSREITGKGYLAEDNPLLLDAPLKIARSMIDLNGRRLAVQNTDAHRMADERTESFQRHSEELLAEAESPGVSKYESLLLARDAATYAELNHPVLRNNIYEAILGIIWYLGLLVPFVFFFEKLVFGFPDIRKQLAAVALVFLVVFVLLKLLHPAFGMVRSSLMILLGFVIMLISLGVTVLFSSKFQENLEEIRKRRGRITAAEVNKLGVLATAFLLGLNNMHRRKVRTWLTCGTLVLMTFVMICFTSVQSDLVDRQVATGKASYSGFLVKNERFLPMPATEVFALKSKYGHICDVLPRYMFVGVEDWETRRRFNPDVRVAFTPEGQAPVEVALDSIIRLAPEEPLARQIKLLTHRGWFTEEQAKAEEGPIPYIISEEAARKLHITPQMVDSSDVMIDVNEQKALLYGIFESRSLREAKDLDGTNLLPFDVTALRQINKHDGRYIIAEDNDPRIAPEKILLAPTGRTIRPGKATEIIHSVAVVLPPDYGYKKSKEMIDRYLEQTGRATYYGLDGFSFLGQRARSRTVEGLVEMIIPLTIAALTVLNTMRGSVYERRSEIFVYNSVGIAPRHIFFMFFAEALVYAVVGSVLGYLLSQGTGRILTMANFTGGLNMTFAGASTIYASLAVAASVFLSTYFPARTAMKIAMPTEDVGWRLPPPGENTWSFPVPFTFSFSDRIAVLAFFRRYFLDHGEGGSGAFFAGKPKMGISEQPDPLAEGAPIPQLEVPVWLKPFDLGVSLLFRMSVAVDPQTHEYVPTITLERLSGARENWIRLSRRFIALIRQRLLYWRAVGDEQRREMFEEARAQMYEDLGQGLPE